MTGKLKLHRIAAHIAEHLFQAHRGALWLEFGRSIIVFGNDGYTTDPRTRTAAGNARRVLEAEGFSVGPVVTDPGDGYTWVFEVVVRPDTPADTALATAEEAVWEGFAASRDLALTGEGGCFCHVQRGIAEVATWDYELPPSV